MANPVGSGMGVAALSAAMTLQPNALGWTLPTGSKPPNSPPTLDLAGCWAW